MDDNDDGCIGCLVTIIVIIMGIAFVIFLISFVVGLLLVTLPAWGSGAVSGIAAYGVARRKLASDLRSPAKFSQFVNFSFDGYKLHCEIKRKTVKDYVTPYNIAPVVLCIAVTIIVFMAVVPEPRMLGVFGSFFEEEWVQGFGSPEEEWVQIFGFFITATVTTGFVFLLLWTRLNLTSAVETQVKWALAQANISFQASGELQGIIRDNALLAQELQIDFPQDDVSAVRNYIDTHKTKVLSDPSSLRTVIAAEIEKAKRDRANLRKAGERFGEAMQLHQKVSRTVFATGSPSMVNEIDSIHEQIHQAKEVCLPKREWATFDEAMTVYTQELKRLEKQAFNLAAGKGPDFNADDPYQVLGVTPEMDNSEIKRVFRELCHIFHPDKGKVRNTEKFKEIKNAYDKIMKQRKSKS